MRDANVKASPQGTRASGSSQRDTTTTTRPAKTTTATNSIHTTLFRTPDARATTIVRPWCMHFWCLCMSNLVGEVKANDFVPGGAEEGFGPPRGCTPTSAPPDQYVHNIQDKKYTSKHKTVQHTFLVWKESIDWFSLTAEKTRCVEKTVVDCRLKPKSILSIKKNFQQH